MRELFYYCTVLKFMQQIHKMASSFGTEEPIYLPFVEQITLIHINLFPPVLIGMGIGSGRRYTHILIDGSWIDGWLYEQDLERMDA